ncbi:MAG: hypothetical protein IJ746_06435 [Ruminococcus sp.]|nr:hypothetical protein [Ruminococcus sp.]
MTRREELTAAVLTALFAALLCIGCGKDSSSTASIETTEASSDSVVGTDSKAQDISTSEESALE